MNNYRPPSGIKSVPFMKTPPREASKRIWAAVSASVPGLVGSNLVAHLEDESDQGRSHMKERPSNPHRCILLNFLLPRTVLAGFDSLDRFLSVFLIFLMLTKAPPGCMRQASLCIKWKADMSDARWIASSCSIPVSTTGSLRL